MAGDTQVNITPGSGVAIAVYNDSSNLDHQKIILETQSGSSDPQKINAGNPLPVTLAGGGVAGQQDNAAFTPGTGVGLVFMAEIDEVAPTLGTEGNAGAVRMTVQRALRVAQTASSSGGWVPGRYVSAASTNLSGIRSAAAQLGYILVQNFAPYARYLKLYDKASAPVPGTDTPIHTLGLPPSNLAPIHVPFGAGLQFSNGIAFAITGAVGDADTTAIGAGDVILNYGVSP